MGPVPEPLGMARGHHNQEKELSPMIRRRYHLHAVPAPGARNYTIETLAYLFSERPDMFFFRRSAERAAAFYAAMFSPALIFIVEDIRES
jgi:hypothetical protein